MGVIHNEIRRRGSVLKGYQTAFGLDEGGVERLGETLTPIVDLWSQPEWMLLRGERRFLGRRISAAVVGEYSGVGLYVPETSRVIAVLERAVLSIPSAGAVTLGLPIAVGLLATFGTPANGENADRRDRNTVSTALTLIGSDAGIIGPIGQTRRGGGATDLVFLDPVVIPPGEAVVIQFDQANLAVTGSFVWRERLVTIEER